MTGTTEAAPAAATSAVPDGRPRRPRGAVAFPVILVAAILATVGLCLALTRDDGASTPEGALDELVEAIGSGDALGVLLALPPSERQAVTDRIGDLTSPLAALGLVRSGDDALPSLPSLSVDDLRV